MHIKPKLLSLLIQHLMSHITHFNARTNCCYAIIVITLEVICPQIIKQALKL